MGLCVPDVSDLAHMAEGVVENRLRTPWEGAPIPAKCVEPLDRSYRLSSVQVTELRAARRRIKELETELVVTRRANELLKAQVMSPKEGLRRWG